MTERYTAVHTAACLHLSVVGIQSLFYFSEVLYSIVYRTVASLNAWHLQKCFKFSHDDSVNKGDK